MLGAGVSQLRLEFPLCRFNITAQLCQLRFEFGALLTNLLLGPPRAVWFLRPECR
jgi:hypothetical protein